MPAKIVSNGIKRRVIDETLAFLLTYGHQELVDIIHHINETRNARILVGGDNQTLLNKIKENIVKSFPEQDLVDYADLRRAYGPQHIFLYKVGRQDAGILRDLRRPSHVKKLLANHGLADRYNQPQLIWDSPKPGLALVTHKDIPDATLIFRWVETRTWSHTMKPDGKPVVVIKRERSVNFFRVDLDTGECELCIQKMNPNPRLSLQEEHDLYLDLAQKILGINLLHRVNLEPVIRRLLDSKDIKIKSWKVAYERGGYLIGSRDPNLAQRINLFLTPFIGMELKNTWVGDEYTGALTSFNAKNDELLVHNHFPNGNVLDDVLNRVRRHSEIKFKNPMLRELASTNERLETPLSVIDAKISRSAKDGIDCRKLANDHWISQADMLEAVEALMLVNRNKNKLHNMFQVKYQLICPDTSNPILDGNGKPVEFDTRKAIPNRINCHHPFPVGIKKHLTEGNIRPMIKVLPAPSFWDMGVLGMVERPSGLLNFMQKNLGEELGLKTIKIILGLIYSVLFYFAILQIVKVALTSAAQFPDESRTIFFIFTLLVLVLVFILLIFSTTLFGAKVVRQAFEHLKQLVGFARRESVPDKHQKNHKGRGPRKPAGIVKHRHAPQTK